MTAEKEKYQAYLCSREWGLLKRAVHKRSGRVCERCRKNPGDHVHHLTYARKYNELISDLRHLCKGCHDFTHGTNDTDPAKAPSISDQNLGRCENDEDDDYEYEYEYELYEFSHEGTLMIIANKITDNRLAYDLTLSSLGNIWIVSWVDYTKTYIHRDMCFKYAYDAEFFISCVQNGNNQYLEKCKEYTDIENAYELYQSAQEK